MILYLTIIIAFFIALNVYKEIQRSDNFIKSLLSHNDLQLKLNNYSGFVLCVDLSTTSKVYKKVEEICNLFDNYDQNVVVIEGHMIVKKNFKILSAINIETFPTLIYMEEGKNISNNLNLNLSNPDHINDIKYFINYWNSMKGVKSIDAGIYTASN